MWLERSLGGKGVRVEIEEVMGTGGWWPACRSRRGIEPQSGIWLSLCSGSHGGQESGLNKVVT